MRIRSRLAASWRLVAVAVAGALVAAGLVSFDVTHPVAVSYAASSTQSICPPGATRCTDAYPDPTGYGTSGDLATATVIVVGDSISNGCRNEIRTGLTGQGITSAVNYWSGRPTTNGVSWALSLSRKPPVLVMELGSNDWADPSVMTGQIQRLIAGLEQSSPETVVVWVDTYNGNQLLATGWTNQQIWASGLLVASWYAMFAKAPWRDAYYLRDRLHPKTAADAPNNTGQGIGCAFLAANITPTIKSAVVVQAKKYGAVKPK